MISATGLGSGLDVESIVSQLMALERQPVQLLEQRRNANEVELSAYGKLRSALADFQSAMGALGDQSAFKLLRATSEDEEVLAAKASANAAVGSYEIETVRLAERHKLASAELASEATFGGSVGDLLRIQVGSDPAAVVEVGLSSAKTLNEIRDAINGAADNPGVMATTVSGNDGHQKLVLTASESGAANALSLAYGGSISEGALGLETINEIEGDLSRLDAEVVVDGYRITRPVNSIDDVLEGVELDLKAAAPGGSHWLDVERDLEAVGEAVQRFADAFNEVRSTLGDLRRGDLAADGTLLSMDQRMVNLLATPASGLAYEYLSEIGVSFQKDGTLRIDSTRLNDALESDFTGVASLFADETEGFSNRMNALVGGWLETDGLIDTRTDSIERRQDILLDRQDQMERRLEMIEQRYRDQYAALDSIVGQLTATSNFLYQQLAQLS